MNSRLSAATHAGLPFLLCLLVMNIVDELHKITIGFMLTLNILYQS